MKINDEAVLSRDEMRYIMAGSGSTNYLICIYNGVITDICYNYGGTSPYTACVYALGSYPDSASWGHVGFC